MTDIKGPSFPGKRGRAYLFLIGARQGTRLKGERRAIRKNAEMLSEIRKNMSMEA